MRVLFAAEATGLTVGNVSSHPPIVVTLEPAGNLRAAREDSAKEDRRRLARDYVQVPGSDLGKDRNLEVFIFTF